MCVCVRERERESARVCGCVCACVRIGARVCSFMVCLRVCLRACVQLCLSLCVCARALACVFAVRVIKPYKIGVCARVKAKERGGGDFIPKVSGRQS